MLSRNRTRLICLLWLPALLVCLPLPTRATGAEETASLERQYRNILNLYGGQLTTNNAADFYGDGDALDFQDSYMVAAALARQLGAYRHLASFEVEGQIVKHFNLQTHWEFNALGTGRWDAFFWDRYVDTSVAFGLGLSYATEEPEVEIIKDGDTAKLLAYWMVEISLAHPDYRRLAFITRLHHRSKAFGLFNDEGGSNALAFGLKWRF
jgi:hypothetical protein